jgi:hypothetical protein
LPSGAELVNGSTRLFLATLALVSAGALALAVYIVLHGTIGPLLPVLKGA